MVCVNVKNEYLLIYQYYIVQPPQIFIGVLKYQSCLYMCKDLWAGPCSDNCISPSHGNCNNNSMYINLFFCYTQPDSKCEETEGVAEENRAWLE